MSRPSGLGRVPTFPPLANARPGRPSPRPVMTPERAYEELRAFTMAAELIPEPYEPPAADAAPPQLTAFLYYLMRDFLPVGAVQHCLTMASPAGQVHTNFSRENLAAEAELVARQLVFTQDGS